MVSHEMGLRIGLLGDLHGNSLDAKSWIRRTQPDFCIQVGDYWLYDEEWSVPMYWIFGNHERSKAVRGLIDGTYPLSENNRWLMGGLVDIQGVSVMALPGLPQARGAPGPAHYPPKVYELCRRQAGAHVDLFVSHGCGFLFGAMARDIRTGRTEFLNFEEEPITELIRLVRPTYAVSGHNHRFAVEENEGITCIRLGHRAGSLAHMVEIEPRSQVSGADTHNGLP